METITEIEGKCRGLLLFFVVWSVFSERSFTTLKVGFCLGQAVWFKRGKKLSMTETINQSAFLFFFLLRQLRVNVIHSVAFTVHKEIQNVKMEFNQLNQKV